MWSQVSIPPLLVVACYAIPCIKKGKMILTDLYGVHCDNCLAFVNDCANAVMPVFANGFPTIVHNLHTLLGRY